MVLRLQALIHFCSRIMFTTSWRPPFPILLSSRSAARGRKSLVPMQNVLRELRGASTLAPQPDSVPAEVRAIDLASLAVLVGCSVEDLASGIRRGGSTSEGDATVAAPAERVAFEAIPRFVPPEPLGIDIALLSLASRPGVLDSALTPKSLMMLGSQPVIGHVLAQLYAGGIRRVVIVLGARGDILRPAILDLPVASHLRFEFIDLGLSYSGGFARSLLSAAATIGADPFLLATADHIFDAKIVRELRTCLAERAALQAVALVETDDRSREASLPPTAVRVALRDGSGGALITHIGKQVGPKPSGIEAGLYACTTAVFAALTTLL